MTKGTGTMDDLEQHVAERVCEALITTDTHCVDNFGERAKVYELFTDCFGRTADGWRVAHRRADVGFGRPRAVKA
ncbi:MAG: hypothetical protein ACI8TP_005349 [Acidimicrobiales bacterium]|jgi:hypothetical protein